ncbi:12904_t:CDS:2 [Dentiscutata erythropus]|uniref:12904_t:CDS:1 n=1 Tax=Dentiscutata erythropus TaxID=1348616 RepID=A0A9N9H4X9_9GLOM|nr:12904_t:CDS:2 [Dentiscutata erythropus]
MSGTFISELEENQKEQLKYLVLILLLGAGFYFFVYLLNQQRKQLEMQIIETITLAHFCLNHKSLLSAQVGLPSQPSLTTNEATDNSRIENQHLDKKVILSSHPSLTTNEATDNSKIENQRLNTNEVTDNLRIENQRLNTKVILSR